MAVCSLQFHFFAGLSFYTTDKGLLEAFSQFGQVLNSLFHPFSSTNFCSLTLNSNLHEPLSFSLSVSNFYHFDETAKIIVDRSSGRSKGFGFIAYASDAEADKAVSGMNGKVISSFPSFLEMYWMFSIFET